MNDKSIMYCKKCGTKLEGSVKFCSLCGTQVVNTQSSQSGKISKDEQNKDSQSGNPLSRRAARVHLIIWLIIGAINTYLFMKDPSFKIFYICILVLCGIAVLYLIANLSRKKTDYNS